MMSDLVIMYVIQNVTKIKLKNKIEIKVLSSTYKFKQRIHYEIFRYTKLTVLNVLICIWLLNYS